MRASYHGDSRDYLHDPTLHMSISRRGHRVLFNPRGQRRQGRQMNRQGDGQ